MTLARGVLIAAVVALCGVGIWLATSHGQPARLDDSSWAAYKRRFISDDGRVIDRDSVSNGITHTEGLGYGLLLAEAAGDEKTFDALWTWTDKHLRRPDGLFSWRWEDDHIADRNNASDGDVLIAWALLRAARHWHRDELRRASEAIATALGDHGIVRFGKYTLLLPGTEGFQDHEGVVINLSYWIFPAFRDFAGTFRQPAWTALADSGYDILHQARFGTWQLPPDWLRIDGKGLRPADGFPPQYGFNAVRIPLHLAWAAQPTADLLEPFRLFWQSNGGTPPAWVDVRTGAVAPYAWQTGMKAVAALAERLPPPLPLPTEQEGYFSWSLALLARVAAAETRQ